MSTWTKSKMTALTAAIAVASLPVVALAALEKGETLGTDEISIRAALATRGIEMTELDFEDGEIEVEILDGGVAFELELSPETGQIVEIELEDNDD